jgi:hypothetical protein
MASAALGADAEAGKRLVSSNAACAKSLNNQRDDRADGLRRPKCGRFNRGHGQRNEAAD